MPALIVFGAGAAVAAALAMLGPAVGSALAAGIVIGAVLRPLVAGAIQNWLDRSAGSTESLKRPEGGLFNPLVAAIAP